MGVVSYITSNFIVEDVDQSNHLAREGVLEGVFPSADFTSVT